MDSRWFFKLVLPLFAFAFCGLVRAKVSDSIFFLHNPAHRYFRGHSSDNISPPQSLSSAEVSAAISVLLGFSPPTSLTDESSSKLDEVLWPNPFDRPHAIFMIEVGGIKDPSLFLDFSNSQIGGALRSKVVLTSSPAEIQLPDEDDVSTVLLDEPLGFDCDAACTDKEFHELANMLGGSYVGTEALLNWELTLPLASGTSLSLHASKEGDRRFALSLASLVHNVKMAVDMHDDFAGTMHSPAELLIGCFAGVQALQDQYGPRGVAEQGVEIFMATLIKLFDSLQEAYRGKIVGLVIFNEKTSPDSRLISNGKTSTQRSRWLEEESTVNPIEVAERRLVRRTLAWITGIILLVSTFIGIYYLVNMPLTRDTLLYSNVKLD